MSSIFRHLPTVHDPGLTGIIDILVVAFLVYQALMVVRGTRAGHILIGILIMVSLYAIATGLRLEALRSLLSFIVPYLGLAVIVLFQSEIRRTLARLGRKRWFGGGDFHSRRSSARSCWRWRSYPAANRGADRAGARYRPAHLHRKRRAAGIRGFPATC